MATKRIDWLGCLPFEGPERLLPTGIAYMPPNIGKEDLIKNIITSDKSGKVMDVVVDEEIYTKYGSGILIGTADGKRITREDWYEKYNHSDGLKLALIRDMNMKGVVKEVKLGLGANVK